jgi:hypothetical protein
MKKSQALDYSLLLAPVTAATTVRSVAFDCTGADYATILVTLGAELNTNSTNVTLQLAEGDTSTGTWTTFNASYNQVIDNTAGKIVAYHVDLNGVRKSHIRLTITPDTTTNGPVISSAVGVLDLEFSNSANSNNADIVVVG